LESFNVNILTEPSLGWIASLMASFTWAFSVLMFRTHSVGRSPSWLNLFKGSVALLFFGLSAIVTGMSLEVSTRVVWTLAVSGIIGVFIGDSAFFAALIRVGGTMTSAIQSIAPSLTALLAWIFLGEILKGVQILGLSLTSACLVLLVMKQSARQKPQSSHAPSRIRSSYFSGVIFASIAAFCQAAGAVVAKTAIAGLSPISSAALRLWAPVLMLFLWQVHKNRGFQSTFRGLVSGGGIVPMAMASFAGTFLGLILMMYGMAHAPLGVSLALTSTYPVWIMIVEQLSGKSEIGRSGFLLVIGSVAGIWLMV
jgi:drug/metabolite transporter (DMT)-like permease